MATRVANGRHDRRGTMIGKRDEGEGDQREF